jgi:2-polyprenyl-6-methoxyphenol hydroxylase-like FAD-dependent oxidoreductase
MPSSPVLALAAWQPLRRCAGWVGMFSSLSASPSWRRWELPWGFGRMPCGRVPVADLRLSSTVGSARCARSRTVACGQGPAGAFEIDTDLVVAADGVHSGLRPLVDPRTAARYAGHTAWRALIPAGLAPPVAGSSDTWGQGQRFGYAPLGDGGAYWFASALAAADGVMTSNELPVLRERFAAWHEPIPALLEATPAAALLRK